MALQVMIQPLLLLLLLLSVVEEEYLVIELCCSARIALMCLHYLCIIIRNFQLGY